MPSYTLEIEAFGVFTTNMPSLEIWEDGVLDSTHSISSNGTTISVTINYGGTLPTSLALTFNDAFAAAGRTIEIRSVKINNLYVNTGNYLSSDSLSKGQSATVDIDSINTNDSDFIFDSSDPAASEFTTGATETFTAGNDSYRRYNDTDDEVFDMLAGRDVAYLGSGDDKVNGGAGDDLLRGGAGNDLLYGDANNDRIYGGDDDDTIYGGTGNDKLHGQNGDDEIHGGDGDDRLNGHDGRDVITGGVGADKLNGGNGIDFLFGGDDNDQLIGGAGDDTLDGGAGDDIVYGGAGIDNMNGGDGNDVLAGFTGNDAIHGDDGNDIIYGGIGNDTITGGDGDDVITATENVLDVVATLGTGNYLFNINGTLETLHIDYDGTDHWLLVGRGREDWEFDTNGQGTIANMTVGLGTTAAFAPVAYDDTFVNDLITATGNDLTDTQMRLKRAANTAGTEYQEVRWDAISQTDFTFDFDGVNFDVEHRVEDSVLGTAFTDLTSRTRDTMATPGTDTGNNYQRVWDFQWGGKGNIQGFSYGASVAGVNNDDPNTFLWENTTENHATPYTEVYIRLDVATAALNSTLGNDIIDGGAGDDTIIEDLGIDTINGGADNDTISSGAGDDIVSGDAGNDTINGGADDDTIYGDGSFDRDTAISDILTANPSVVYSAASDSFYQLITAGANHTTARANALSTTINGVGGYLANITSTAENTFIDNLIVADTWIGGSDVAAEGVWIWEDGREAGQQFWAGAAGGSSVGGFYENWNSGEPNNSGNEDNITIRTNGTWNDLRGTNNRDYIIEWDADSVLGSEAGDDIINGGDGNDTIYGDFTSAVIGSSQGWFYEYFDLASAPSNLATAGFTLNGGRDNSNAVDGRGITQDTNPVLFDGTSNYALKFTTTLTVTTGGTYTFRTTSDDGSALFLDGVQIVNNDGLHGAVTVTSAGQALVAGTYTLEATFFERGGGEVMDITMSGPDTGGGFINLENYAGANVNANIGSIADGDDIIIGGDGLDTLYGGGGSDDFVFEAVSAFSDTDVIMDFSTIDGDRLDISDILTGTFSGTITDYVQFSISGGDTLVQVDANGLTGGSSYSTIASLDNLTGLDEATLFADGNIVV